MSLRYTKRSFQAKRLVITTNKTLSANADTQRVTFRKPTKEDGARIWQLVKDTGVLDVNSVYVYLLIGEHFGQTSVIAEIEDELAGFISAYFPPDSKQTLFVWQAGVAEAGRGKGMATRMLYHILNRDNCRDIRYIDTTISPDNDASMALFRGLARKLDTQVTENELFGADLFGPGGDHQPEVLFHIGPFDTQSIPKE